MRALAEAYPDGEFVQQVVALLPWGQNVRLLDAVKNSEERSWYLRQAVQNGWSRNVLMHQIEGGLYQRQGKAITNFTWTLPAPQSELAQQLIKDPYNFDFLTLGPEMDERALERGLIEHVRDFILELGKGFAFIGSQQHLQVGGQDFFMDLLFYHVRLRCYVVIDLKIEEFKPEFAGKMNFYLAAVDEQMRHTGDSPTIGIILCKGRNEVIVEYSLRETNKPMGVAQYQLTHGESLPERLQEELPTVEELMKLLKGKQVASTWAGTPENVNGRMFEVLGASRQRGPLAGKTKRPLENLVCGFWKSSVARRFHLRGGSFGVARFRNWDRSQSQHQTLVEPADLHSSLSSAAAVYRSTALPILN